MRRAGVPRLAARGLVHRLAARGLVHRLATRGLVHRLTTRALVVGGLVVACALLAGPAEARRVVHIPTIAELCPGNAEWSSVATCIKRQAPFSLVRDEAALKLVHIAQDGGRFGGVYLYRHDKQWALRGEVRLFEPHEILGVQRVTYGKRSGERIDIGIVAPSSFSPDGENSIQALVRQQLTAVCLDDTSGCVQVTTSCELLVHGKAYYSFRGKLVYASGKLQVVGDRTNAGPVCNEGDLVFAD